MSLRNALRNAISRRNDRHNIPNLSGQPAANGAPLPPEVKPDSPLSAPRRKPVQPPPKSQIASAISTIELGTRNRSTAMETRVGLVGWNKLRRASSVAQYLLVSSPLITRARFRHRKSQTTKLTPLADYKRTAVVRKRTKPPGYFRWLCEG